MSIVVLCDNTDVFVGLCHFKKRNKIPNKVYMVSPKEGKLATDIDATVATHGDLLSSLLEAHLISGCDIVCSYHGIGKSTALSVLRYSKCTEMIKNKLFSYINHS